MSCRLVFAVVVLSRFSTTRDGVRALLTQSLDNTLPAMLK
jgi:hypothetical protein